MYGRVLLLLLGAFACSTSVIFMKASRIDPILLACYRLTVATLVLLPLFVRDLRAHRERFGTPELRRTLLPGLVLGVHFISWIIGARLTPAVNSTSIVNMVPVATPFLLLAIAHEALNRREWVGTLLAVLGVLLLAGSDFQFNPLYFRGDAICLVSMILFAIYLVMGRRNRDFPSLWLYLVPLYAVAASCCLAISLFSVGPFEESYSLRELWLILGLGLVPTVLGHSILNDAMKHFRGQVVSTINLSQAIFAGVLAFFFLGEVPDPVFYPACVLMALGASVALRGDSAASLPDPTREDEQAA